MASEVLKGFSLKFREIKKERVAKKQSGTRVKRNMLETDQRTVFNPLQGVLSNYSVILLQMKVCGKNTR